MANEPTDFFKMALDSWRYARAGEFGVKAYDLIEAHVVAGGEVRAVALMLPAALAASMTHDSLFTTERYLGLQADFWGFQRAHQR